MNKVKEFFGRIWDGIKRHKTYRHLIVIAIGVDFLFCHSVNQ